MAVVFKQALSVHWGLKFRRKCVFDFTDFEPAQCWRFCSNVSFNEKPNLTAYVQKKVNNFSSWYENVIGLKDIRIAQDKVSEASDRLVALQEQRRQDSAALRDIQYKLKQIRFDLDNTKRGEDRFLQLVYEENKLLKEEDYYQAKFIDAERAEREQFTFLISAVKNSHEMERFNSKKTKYWSIIGSVIGAILGIFGTTISNNKRYTEFKKLHESLNGTFMGELKKVSEISEQMLCYLNVAEKNRIENKSPLNEKNETQSSEEEKDRRMKKIILVTSLICLLVPLFYGLSH